MMTNDLATLVGSRICHDLISPIGAIGNGVELMSLTGGGDSSAEMALIADSVENASARIRFFRVAFGAATPGQTFPRREVIKILADIARGGRISYDWQIEGDCDRTDVRSAFLLFQCFETAMTHGGDITISRVGATWTLTARAERFRIEPDLWSGLTQPGVQVVDAASQVQFALLPQVMAECGCRLEIVHDETALTATFAPH